MGTTTVTATLMIASNDPVNPVLPVPLQGSGTTASGGGGSNTDIDGDGKQDLAVYYSSPPGYVYSLLSSGTGIYNFLKKPQAWHLQRLLPPWDRTIP